MYMRQWPRPKMAQSEALYPNGQQVPFVVDPFPPILEDIDLYLSLLFIEWRQYPCPLFRFLFFSILRA